MMMARYEGMFELLDFSDGPDLGRPQITGNRLAIPIKNLTVLPGHPLANEKPRVIPRARLVFDGTQRSSRRISPYAHDPRLQQESLGPVFLPERSEDDGPFPAVKNDVTHFHIDGVMERPEGPVCWEVDATSFVLLHPTGGDGEV
jgi:hypothetical protein